MEVVDYVLVLVIILTVVAVVMVKGMVMKVSLLVLVVALTVFFSLRIKNKMRENERSKVKTGYRGFSFGPSRKGSPEAWKTGQGINFMGDYEKGMSLDSDSE
jgi:hypothetical protein